MSVESLNVNKCTIFNQLSTTFTRLLLERCVIQEYNETVKNTNK